MATHSAHLLALGASLALAGCASPGPIGSRHTMLGTLKTSVAQLESDNQSLRRQVAQLKAENTRIEDDLVQAEAANGEMSARLDDAKELLSRQGGDSNALGRGKASSEDDIPPPVKTINRSGRRQPPAASIPRSQPLEPDDDPLDPGPAPRKRDRDLGPQGRLDDEESRWLPVARRHGIVPIHRY